MEISNNFVAFSEYMSFMYSQIMKSDKLETTDFYLRSLMKSNNI